LARRLVVGIDLGGTKVSAGIADLEGVVLHRIEQPTDTESPESCVNQLSSITRELLDRCTGDGELACIGIGVPGITESETGLVVWAPNLPGWRNIPLGQQLSGLFHVPVLVENDVDVAVLGEWWQGAGKGARNVMLIAVGTGIGGGMIIDGRLYKGSGGVAGAVGWFVIGEDCLFREEYASGGCAEYLAAGPGIGRRGQQAAEQNPSTLMLKLAGGKAEAITSRIVFEAAAAGDEPALQVVQYTARYLGIVVANAISLLNPEVIIIGGGVGEAGDILLKPIAEIAKAHAQPVSAASVRIEPAVLGNKAGLIGALCLAAEHEQHIQNTEEMREA